ncbi:hypothetical protein SAMN04487909_12470 [Aneurinibacillus migulanus]|uniref:Uncharacterized protein n=1 Tax=Aneurinibacillus migulanus TaxID=47500 RepID=A0A1G8VM07_ANEMI|nr:hypothetical protein SAMN04487909_12470 [Aneurinibacillus migulanus]
MLQIKHIYYSPLTQPREVEKEAGLNVRILFLELVQKGGQTEP